MDVIAKVDVVSGKKVVFEEEGLSSVFNAVIGERFYMIEKTQVHKIA